MARPRPTFYEIGPDGKRRLRSTPHPSRFGTVESPYSQLSPPDRDKLFGVIARLLGDESPESVAAFSAEIGLLVEIMRSYFIILEEGLVPSEGDIRETLKAIALSQEDALVVAAIPLMDENSYCQFTLGCYRQFEKLDEDQLSPAEIREAAGNVLRHMDEQRQQGIRWTGAAGANKSSHLDAYADYFVNKWKVHFRKYPDIPTWSWDRDESEWAALQVAKHIFDFGYFPLKDPRKRLLAAIQRNSDAHRQTGARSDDLS